MSLIFGEFIIGRFTFGKLDYYQQTMNIRVASRFFERFKNEDLRKLRNFKKISEVLRIDGQVPSWPLKKGENLQKK